MARREGAGSEQASFEVLVAEPDELQLQLVDLLLADQRIRVVQVASARAALEHLRGNTPDLVIVASDLADLGGFALTSRIKRVARLAGVPVIVTAEPDAGLGVSQAVRRQAEEAHVDLLLPRPLGDKNLKERALRLMQQRSAPASEPKAAPPRPVGTTLVLDEAIENLPAWRPPEAPAALRDEREALMRENEALRRENAELRSSLASLKKQLNEARRVGRPKSG